jgi:hypothetical protein
LENGAEALLTKPIDFGTLCSEIDMRVERAAFGYGRTAPVLDASLRPQAKSS